jgi:hypothetical protein
MLSVCLRTASVKTALTSFYSPELLKYITVVVSLLTQVAQVTLYRKICGLSIFL